MNTTENTLVENTNYVDESVSVEKVDGRHNNKGRNPKDYSVHNNNKLYLDGYLASLSSVSMPQYRVDVYPYLFGLGQKALHNTTIDDVEKFFAILGENEKKQRMLKGSNQNCIVQWLNGWPINTKSLVEILSISGENWVLTELYFRVYN